MLKIGVLYLQAIARSAYLLKLNRCCCGGVVGSGFGGYEAERVDRCSASQAGQVKTALTA